VAVPKALTNEVNLIQGAARRNPSLTKWDECHIIKTAQCAVLVAREEWAHNQARTATELAVALTANESNP
jgi:hypothetical protein